MPASGTRRSRALWAAAALAAVGAVVGAVLVLVLGGDDDRSAQPAVPEAWRTPSGLLAAAGKTAVRDGSGDYIFSIPEVEAGFPSADVDIREVAVGTLTVDREQVDELFNDSAYPCGEAPIVCVEPLRPMPPGELAVFGVTFAEAPGRDPPARYTYGLVFDTDGDPANDFRFRPPFEWDFFRDTDRWYQAHDEGGWRLEVSTWDRAAGRDVAAVSAARVLLDGTTMVWVVPTRELGERPAWRVTAFRHDGSFEPAASAGDVNGADPTTAPTPLE